jgi:hypothetical protein
MVSFNVIFCSEDKGVDGNPIKSYKYHLYGFDAVDTGHEFGQARIVPDDNIPKPSRLEFLSPTESCAAAVDEALQILREFFQNSGLKEKSNCP